MVAIFDSLVHPTLSGKYFGSISRDASFEKLSDDLKAEGFRGACAVGLAGVEGYDHEKFWSRCAEFPELFPVAGIHPSASDAEFDSVKRLGYSALKIHYRLSKEALSAESLGRVFQLASARDMVVFYCAYAHNKIEDYPDEDPFFTLVKALKKVPQVKVVLLHGGDVNVLRYGELARFNPNLLLDLSFTLLKFQGSSLDCDLRFLFSQLDRRICVGSDHPEFQLRETKARVLELAQGIPAEKLDNIAFGNLRRFLLLD